MSKAHLLFAHHID
jgi:hypothetical protein